MVLKIQSLASALAIAFALLAFGGASAAKADPLQGVVVQAGYAPVAHYGHGHAYVRPYRPYRPYYGRRYYARPYAYGVYAYPAPVPLVRVFVPLPFPHWVTRPAYAAPYYGPYRPY
jgi:hypothetical protein